MDAIGSSTTAAPVSPAKSGSASSRTQLSRDDFYKIMISELSNQDPMNPLDNRQFLDQMASLQNLETSGKLADGITQLVRQNQLSSASGLIGRDVKATTVAADASGSPTSSVVEGRVSRVLVDGGTVKLLFSSGQQVTMDEVSEVA